MALTSKETSIRKLMPRIMAKEIMRCLNRSRQKCPGFGSTPHTRFRAICSCPKTEDAPISKTMMLTMFAIVPCSEVRTDWIALVIESAALTPTRLEISL